MFVNSNHTIVTGEAVLLVSAENANLVRSEIYNLAWQLTIFTFDKLAPGSNVWQRLDRVCPLAP